MSRVNLVTNPSATLNTNGWEAFGDAEISSVSVNSHFGGTAFNLRFTSVVADCGIRSVNYIDVTPSVVYTISVFPYIQAVSVNDSPITLRLRVEWFSDAYALLGSNDSDPVTAYPADRWADRRISLVAQAYDANGGAGTRATKARISVYRSVAGKTNEVILLDGFLMERSDYVGQFFNNFTQAEENKLVNQALKPVPFPNITGMQLNADVSLGDLTLNTIDEDGTVWVCTDIQGWWNSAPSEVPDITRGTRDGSYSVTGRRSARTITLSGAFLPQDSTKIAKARNKLVEAIDLVRRSTWLRTNEDPTKAAEVWLIGEPAIETVNARGRTQFTINLRAPDPIKYEWNDKNQDGYSVTSILPTTNRLGRTLVNNSGNTSINPEFTVTGPLGYGSFIDASGKSSDTSIATSFSLRKEGVIASITKMSAVDEVVTVTTDYISNLEVGDVVSLSGIPDTVNPVNSQTTVSSVSNTEPYTFSYNLANVQNTADDIPLTAAYVSLVDSDVLTIDTYNQSVIFNGSTSGHRSKLEPLIDWIQLEAGDNLVGLTDNLEPYAARFKSYNATTGVATLVLDRAHNLSVGDTLTMALPEYASIATSQIAGNEIILSTSGSHGFTAGDKIDVVISTAYTVVNKEVDAHTTPATVSVILKTDVDHSIRVGDRISVTLPTTASITEKQATSSKVTLTTSAPHGFSAGDTVSVVLPLTGYISSRKVENGKVTLVTNPPHNFSVGDSVQVVLPTTVNVTSKTISGTQATLTTATTHGYAVGDVVQVSLPTSVNIATTSSFSWGGASGGYLMTINTATSHAFDVGDKITFSGVTGTPDWSTGTRIIETVPSNTSLTFYYFPTPATASGNLATASITNSTNTTINGATGTRTLTATSAYTFGFETA